MNNIGTVATIIAAYLIVSPNKIAESGDAPPAVILSVLLNIMISLSIS